MICIRCIEKNLFSRKMKVKTNSSQWFKSPKCITITIKIILQHYCDIFRFSYGYGISEGKNGYNMNPNFKLFSQESKEGFYAPEHATTSLGICKALELVQKLMCVTFVYIYSNKNTYKLYSVSAKEKFNKQETLWYNIYGSYHLLFDTVYRELAQATK